MTKTNREIISRLRKLIQEKDADSTYTNKFLFSIIGQNSKWLIRREISAGRIYRSSSLFQVAPCIEVIKANIISDCCPIKTNCVMYRTRYKLDEIWQDEYGPVITNVTSIDGSVSFKIVSMADFQRKKANPYQSKNSEKYGFFDPAGYIWFEEKAPKMVNIHAFFSEDISSTYGCDPTCCEDACVPFLDKLFMCPDWIEAELIARCMEQLFNSKKIPEDNKVDKNPNVTK